MTLAEDCAKALWNDDRASAWLGFEIQEVTEGGAVVAMTVAPHHCNGFGILHGGITFALADSAFAFACNSRNQATVAQSNTITYLAPGREGDRLIATAREVQLTGRTGLYDVTVTRSDKTVIAEFRGQSRAISGTVIPEGGDAG